MSHRNAIGDRGIGLGRVWTSNQVRPRSDLHRPQGSIVLYPPSICLFVARSAMLIFSFIGSVNSATVAVVESVCSGSVAHEKKPVSV
jgi:hypothetical protein